jgi:hypothetical protein
VGSHYFIDDFVTASNHDVDFVTSYLFVIPA